MSDDDALRWHKIMEIVKQSQLPLTLPENLENLINIRRKLTKELKDFSESVRAQEKIVCVAKGVCVVGTAIGAGLTCSSLFPLGLGITAVSSVLLDVVNLSDWIAEKWKERKLAKMLEKDQTLAKLFINDMNKLDLLCSSFLREKVVPSKDEGYRILISTLMLGKSLATDTGIAIALWKPLKDVYLNGSIRYPTTACIKCGKKVKDTLGFISWSLAVVTAVIAFADFAISCLGTKSCRTAANRAKNVVDESMSHLNALKEIIDEEKNQ